jgi:hypothetical protein
MNFTPEAIRASVPQISADEAAALADWYAALSGAVAAFPLDDLKRAEPPLRSAPGPA